MLILFFLLNYSRPTVCVTGGWGEKSLKTGNCQSSEPAPKNAQSPSRPVHAVLARVLRWRNQAWHRNDHTDQQDKHINPCKWFHPIDIGEIARQCHEL